MTTRGPLNGAGSLAFGSKTQRPIRVRSRKLHRSGFYDKDIRIERFQNLIPYAVCCLIQIYENTTTRGALQIKTRRQVIFPG